MKSKRLIAFTLIELLVVIAIVGILSGFVLVSLNSATNQATDARRKSDLSQIVKALLVYNTSNPTYPIETCAIGSTCSSAVNDALGSAASITGPNNTYYTYSSDDGTSFTVSAIMSNTNTYTYDSETGYSESLTEQVLPGYAKRQPITINSASALTDYQVKLTVAYDTDMQPDFDDLRFTSSNGITELSYWLESKTDSTTATIWVKIPSLASGDNTIYMYYANASATTASNGDNTFEFFDDFSGAAIDSSKWTTSSGSPTISSGICSIVNSTITSISTFATSYAMRSHARLGSNGGVGNYQSLYFGTSPGCTYVDFGNGGNTNYSFNTYNGSSAQTTNIGNSGSYPSYGIWELQKISGSMSRLYINNSLIATNTQYINTTAGPLSPNASGSGFVYVDWMLVRKFIISEPTSSFGTEQNN